MGIGSAADRVIGDLVVHSIEWDWTTMDGMTAALWADIQSRYPLGKGGGGFTVANSDLQSEDDAHRHKMHMVVILEGDIKFQIYRDGSRLLADQIREGLIDHFGSDESLIDFLATPRGGGHVFLQRGFKPPEKSDETQEIFLPKANHPVKIDRFGMLHHTNGKFAGKIKSITQLRVRPDGAVWYQTKSKTGRKTWKKVK